MSLIAKKNYSACHSLKRLPKRTRFDIAINKEKKKKFQKPNCNSNKSRFIFIFLSFFTASKEKFSVCVFCFAFLEFFFIDVVVLVLVALLFFQKKMCSRVWEREIKRSRKSGERNVWNLEVCAKGFLFSLFCLLNHLFYFSILHRWFFFQYRWVLKELERKFQGWLKVEDSLLHSWSNQSKKKA